MRAWAPNLGVEELGRDRLYIAAEAAIDDSVPSTDLASTVTVG